MRYLAKFLPLMLIVPIGLAYGIDKLTSFIPLKVDAVSTTRVNDRLVRTILYTTDKSVQLDIELIRVPEMTTLIDKKIINKINIIVSGQQKVLDFADSAAVSIDAIHIEDGIVKFNVEFFVRVHGGNYLSTCEVDVNKARLPEPMCILLKQGP